MHRPTRPKLAHARPRRDYSATDPVARELGLRWRMRPNSVLQLLYGRHRLDQRCKDVIEVMEQCGTPDRAARWTAPIRAALAGVVVDPLTRQLLRDAQMADLAEDAAQEEYRLAETPEAAKAWIQKIDVLVSWLLRLRRSLIERHHLDDH